MVKLIVSGEGPTDIGTQPHGTQFQPGPMTLIVDALLRPLQDSSIFDPVYANQDLLQFVHKAELATQRRNFSIRLPGHKRPSGVGFHYKYALYLGTIAAPQVAAGPVVAVFFRDSDGTNSVSAKDWEDKFQSILNGFSAADFLCGVPMLPRPKSEAWLLCALRNPAYQNCHTLEDEPGNDASPRSLKSQLDQVLGEPSTAELICRLLSDGRIMPGLIEMPSFVRFHNRLREAYQEAITIRE